MIHCLFDSIFYFPWGQMGTCDRCDFGGGAAPGLDYRKMVSAGRSHLQHVPLKQACPACFGNMCFVTPKSWEIFCKSIFNFAMKHTQLSLCVSLQRAAPPCFPRGPRACLSQLAGSPDLDLSDRPDPPFLAETTPFPPHLQSSIDHSPSPRYL